MVKRFWRAEAGIFLAIWATLMVIGRGRLFRDPGTLWHTVVGERILATGSPIRTDPFSFTEAGEPWISRQWLVECLMALVHRIGGLDGLLLATATALALLYAWVAHRLIRAGVHWPLAVFLTVLTIAASSYHFLVRPHLASIVLLGWTFARLCDVEAGRLPPRSLSWLVPAFVLWTNAHDGVLGGIATVALTVAGWGLVGLICRDGPMASGRRALMLGSLVVACGLTTLVNPFGLGVYRAWFSLLGSSVLPRLFDEHGPLLERPTGWFVFPLALLYVAALLGTLPGRPRVTWLIPLAWLVLAFTRVRHGPLFAITAAVALADVFPRVRWADWLARRGSELFRLRSPEPTRGPGWSIPRAALLPAALVLATLALQAAGIAAPVLGRGWVRLERARWPVDLLPELRRYARAHPEGTPIFNEMPYGGFLIYFTPDLRVFIDDRCELYGDRGLLAYVDALLREPSRVDDWARRHGFDLALTATGSPFDRYLAEADGWVAVRRTPTASLYRRAPSDAEG